MNRLLVSNTAFAIAGCLLTSCHGDAREADPYAARMATSKPAYVRTAAVPGITVVADSAGDPAFTEQQALAGAKVYAATCARCHATPQWSGSAFQAGWKGRRLSDFYELVANTMPQDAPGMLASEQYVNVTAYVLKLAGFASGPQRLSADTAMLRHARLSMKPAANPRS